MKITCRWAFTELDFAQAAILIREHITALRVPGAQIYADVNAHSLEKLYNNDRSRILLAEKDLTVIGLLAFKDYDDDCAMLNYFYVNPDVRGQGAGHLLITEVLNTIRSAGYQQVMLATLPKLTAARALYDAFGFHPIPPAFPDLPGAEFFMRRV